MVVGEVEERDERGTSRVEKLVMVQEKDVDEVDELTMKKGAWMMKMEWKSKMSRSFKSGRDPPLPVPASGQTKDPS